MGLLTHGHMITQIAIALGISQSSLSSMRCVRLIHFTKQAFIRGEVIDACFNLWHARERSCWIKQDQTPQIVQVEEECEEESDNHEHNASKEGVAQPQQHIFEYMEVGGGIPSAHSDLTLWQQVLDG